MSDKMKNLIARTLTGIAFVAVMVDAPIKRFGVDAEIANRQRLKKQAEGIQVA